MQFLYDTYPEVKDLASVRRAHCEAYVRCLVDNDRWKVAGMNTEKRLDFFRIIQKIHFSTFASIGGANPSSVRHFFQNVLNGFPSESAAIRDLLYFAMF